MADDVILRIKVLADATAAAAGLKQAETATSKWQSGLRKAALPAAAAGAAIIALGKKSLSAASDLQQSQGAIEAVFGKNAKAVEKNSQSAARTMGLSASAYQNYAALVGTALQNAGFSVKDSVTESNKVMQRGADLSALYGGTTSEAVEAINAAVARSEFDPLEKYGASLSMTAVNAELAAKGQDKLTGAALDTAKKAAILELVMKKTSKAHGQYAREADSASGAQQSMAAEAENMAASLGTILLPAASKVAAALGDMAKWAAKNVTTVQILLGVIAGLAATILVANAALKVAAVVQGLWNIAQVAGSKAALGTRIQLIALAVAQYAQAAATAVVTAATWAWTVATTALGVAMKFLAANPVFLVVAAVIALGVALVVAYKKSATFRAFVNAMWRGIQAAARATWTVIKAVWNGVLAAGRAVWNAVKVGFQVAFVAVAAYARIYLTAIKVAFWAVKTAVGLVSSAVSALKRWISGIKVPGAIAAAFDTIKRAVGATKDAISSLISWVARIKAPSSIGSAFDTIKRAVDGAISAVKSLITWLGRIKVPKISLPKVKNPFSRSAAAPSSAARLAATSSYGLAGARALAGPVPLAGGSASGGVVININGALDPEGVARQVARLLSAHGQRIGATRGQVSL